MAVYTTITQTEAQQLFKPLGEIKKFEGIREGVENTNYLVHLDDSKKYILTIFEKRTNEKDLEQNEHNTNKFKISQTRITKMQKRKNQTKLKTTSY